MTLNPNSLVLILVAALCARVAWKAWQRRDAPGALILTGYMLALTGFFLARDTLIENMSDAVLALADQRT